MPRLGGKIKLSFSIHTVQEGSHSSGLPRVGSDVSVSEACGLARCAVYTSREEAAAPRLDLPLPQVYSRLYGGKKGTLHFLGMASFLRCCQTILIFRNFCHKFFQIFKLLLHQKWSYDISRFEILCRIANSLLSFLSRYFINFRINSEKLRNLILSKQK